MYENISTKELMEYSVQISKRIDMMHDFPECFAQPDIYNAKAKYHKVIMELQQRNVFGDRIDG